MSQHHRRIYLDKKFSPGNPLVTVSGESVPGLNLAKDALRDWPVAIGQEVQNRMIILTHHPLPKTLVAVRIRPITNDQCLHRHMAVKPIQAVFIFLPMATTWATRSIFNSALSVWAYSIGVSLMRSSHGVVRFAMYEPLRAAPRERQERGPT